MKFSFLYKEWKNAVNERNTVKNTLLFILCILVCTSHADQSPPEIVDGRVCIDTEDGYTYFVRSSIDMVNFSYVGTYKVGVKGAIYEHLLDLAQNLGFVTYEIAPTNLDDPDDTDGDGISNLRELRDFKGLYDPTKKNTDGVDEDDGEEDLDLDGIPNKDDLSPLERDPEIIQIMSRGVTRSGSSESNISYKWFGTQPETTEEVNMNTDLGGWVYEDISVMDTGKPEPYSTETASSKYTTYQGETFGFGFANYNATNADYLIRNNGGVQDYPITRYFLIRKENTNPLVQDKEVTYELASVTIPAGAKEPDESLAIKLRPSEGYAKSIALLDLVITLDSQQDIQWDKNPNKILEPNPVVFQLGRTNLEDPCAYQSSETGMLLSFDECFDYDLLKYKDVSVALKSHIKGESPDVFSYAWSKKDESNTGVIKDENSSQAIFSSPKKSGIYKINFDVSLHSKTYTTETQIVCPQGGPDMTIYANSEIIRYRDWVFNLSSFYLSETAKDPLQEALIFTNVSRAYYYTIASMKHGFITPQKDECPCRRVHDVISSNGNPSTRTTGTFGDYVFKMDWLGNMLLGVVYELYPIWEPLGFPINRVGAFAEYGSALKGDGQFEDSPADIEAYKVGALMSKDEITLKEAIEKNNIQVMQEYPANVLWPCNKTFVPQIDSPPLLLTYPLGYEN